MSAPSDEGGDRAGRDEPDQRDDDIEQVDHGDHGGATGAIGDGGDIDDFDDADDFPTETLPRAVDPAEPRTEVIDSEAVQAGRDGAPGEDAEPAVREAAPGAAEAPRGHDRLDGHDGVAGSDGAVEVARAAEDVPAAPAAAVPVPAPEREEPGTATAAADEPPPPAARTAAPPAGRGPRGRVVVAGVAALVAVGLVAWLVVTLVRASGEPPVATDTGPVTAAPAGFGEEVAGPDGWAVAISLPEAAEAADLPGDAARAVRLEVTLTNDAAEPRDSAGWTVKATADGRAVELLPTDGRSTTEVPSRTVLPGSPLRFAVEVPMPADEAELQLEAVLAGSPPVLFVGPA